MDLLFWSIVVSFTNMFSLKGIPKLVSLVLEYYRGDREIKSQIISLEKEQSEVSIVREFAKHAKLQRKINKLVEQRENNLRTNVSSNLTIKFICNLIVYVMCFILNSIFVYWNYNQIVLDKLPSDWFSPLSWYISWPLSNVGTMSFLFWYSITNYVAKATVYSVL